MKIMSLLGQASPYYNYSNDYYYNSTPTPSDEAATIGAIIFFMVFMLFIAVAAYVVTSLFLGRIFKKAGIESWKAWVPVYNTWIMLEMGGQPGYWAILALIPIVNIVACVFICIAMYQIGLNFGKEGAFVLLAIFLPLVWLIWLAVDKSTWKGGLPAAAQAPAKPSSSAEPPQPPVNTAPSE